MRRKTVFVASKKKSDLNKARNFFNAFRVIYYQKYLKLLWKFELYISE